LDFGFAITLASARLVQSKIQNPQSKIAMSIYRRVLRYYRPFLPQTIVGLLLSILGIGLNLLKPWPFKIIVDDFLRPGATPRGEAHTWLPLLCVALVVIQFLWGIINWITNYLLVKVGLQALLKLRTDLYSYLQSLSLKYHDVRRSSDSSFRVAYDSQSIQTIYNKGFSDRSSRWSEYSPSWCGWTGN
jgi:ABC-type multidrug transport system fused ATPase/permease subunit